jgi:ribosomal protein L18E
MSMQDKDMDELFRAKLDNLEIQPSDRVWKGITVELDGDKRKRGLIPLIRIAAGVTIFIAVGLFFLMKTDKVNNNQAGNHLKGRRHTIKLSEKGETEVTDEKVEDLMQAKQDAQQVAAETVKQAQIKQTQLAKAGQTGAINNKLATITNTTHQYSGVISETEKPDNEEQQEIMSQRETLAAISTNDDKAINSVVPDEPLIAAKPVIPATDDFKTTNKVAVTALPFNKAAKTPVKKHGIRSFGDLINVVVAKVDKRQDKVIHFSDTDGDESSITGINLGFVKMKTDK